MNEAAFSLIVFTIDSRFRSRHTQGAYYRDSGNLRAYRASQKENADYIRDMIRWVRNEKASTKTQTTASTKN